MNKILKVLALGAMALSTTACSDFLEVNPRTQVSETEFYKTEDDMMKGLYAVMNEMQTRMPEVADKIKFYIGDVRDLQPK